MMMSRWLNYSYKKHPSSVVNPANQELAPGFTIFGDKTKDLSIGVILGKADVNSSERPKLMEALRETILHRPFSVKCSLFWIK